MFLVRHQNTLGFGFPNRGAPVRSGSVGHHKNAFFKISFPGIESPYNAPRMNVGLRQMKSLVVKRSVHINGHKTSVSLEDAFWSGLKEIADAQGTTLSAMVAEIDKKREQSNLSSAIRLFVLDQVRNGRRTSVIEEGRQSSSASR